VPKQRIDGTRMEPSPTINKKKKEDPAQLRPKEEEADAGEDMRVTYDLYRAYNMQSNASSSKNKLFTSMDAQLGKVGSGYTRPLPHS